MTAAMDGRIGLTLKTEYTAIEERKAEAYVRARCPQIGFDSEDTDKVLRALGLIP